jgi:carbonic anhydrase
MSDERIYEAEYLPHTEEFYIFSRQETIPVTSERIEHWTYAADIWSFHTKTV